MCLPQLREIVWDHELGAVLRLASVNHSGDTDSTGAICGNLVGAAQGVEACPPEWASALDVGDIVTQVADDLWRERFEPRGQEPADPPLDWCERYPGW